MKDLKKLIAALKEIAEFAEEHGYLGGFDEPDQKEQTMKEEE